MDDERPTDAEEPQLAEEAPLAREAAATGEPAATRASAATKVTPVVSEAEAAQQEHRAAQEAPVLEEAQLSLGPLFTVGAVLLLVGVLRRRPLAAAAGIGAIWLDQRSELGQNLKRRVDGALKAQIKAHARG